jgi:threonine synthase
LGEGGTFLHHAKRLGQELRLGHLHLKDETTNPTGSFVDRGVTVSLSHAGDLGSRSVVCATTGNIGAAAAAYAAKAGMPCRLCVALSVDLGKLYQMIACGATVEPCSTYEAATARVNASGVNAYVIDPADPYFLEGEKTTGYEIVEQLGGAPDRIVVPVGNGGHLAMIWKSLCELALLQDGIRPRCKMTGAQLSTAAPVVAEIAGEDGLAGSHTMASLASEIAVPQPATGQLAVQAIRESSGGAVAVTEEEVFAAMQALARYEGIFAEPAAAATIAAVIRMRQEGTLTGHERVVCVITGSGLKDPSTANRLIPESNAFAKLRMSSQAVVSTQPVGATKIELLRALAQREDYAYSLWKALAKKRGTHTRVPTVYQHLAELVAMGLIVRTHAQRAVRGRARQFYTLTPRGRELVASLATVRT